MALRCPQPGSIDAIPSQGLRDLYLKDGRRADKDGRDRLLSCPFSSCCAAQPLLGRALQL